MASLIVDALQISCPALGLRYAAPVVRSRST